MPLQVINPYDQSVYVELPYDDDTAIGRKLDRARAAQEQWRRLSVAQRATHIGGALAYFRSHRDRIAEQITRQMGKPIVQAGNEFGGFFERAEYMLSIAEKALAADVLEEKPGFYRRIEHVPLGVVLDIAAWNYPLLIPVNVVVPALLAGNAVLLKHSARTPLCGHHFEKAFGEQVPGLVQNLVMDHRQTLEAIADSRVDHVVFTGSVPGGHAVYRAASRRFIDVGLELGGKDPAYVAADADLPFTVANVVDGACYNSGQSCCAVERVYVHRRCYDEFVQRAERLMSQYVWGDPMDPDTTLGPLISPAAVSRLVNQVEDACRQGARLQLGGRQPDATSGNFFLPTLLLDTPNRAAIMQEESFGPLVPVQAVSDDEEALARMNDSRFGLTASLWTTDLQRAEWLAARLKVGTVYQNRCDYLDPALPWTGIGDSGKGSSLSRYGFYHLTRRKSLHFRTAT